MVHVRLEITQSESLGLYSSKRYTVCSVLKGEVMHRCNRILHVEIMTECRFGRAQTPAPFQAGFRRDWMTLKSLC